MLSTWDNGNTTWDNNASFWDFFPSSIISHIRTLVTLKEIRKLFISSENRTLSIS